MGRTDLEGGGFLESSGNFSGGRGAAAEAEAAGKKRVTPYWRTLKGGGEINGKYPGGAEGVARRLRGEGHRVVRRGKRWFVEGWEGKVGRL